MADDEILDVLGAPVGVLTFEQSLNRALDYALDHRRTKFVVAINPEKVMTARKDAIIAEFLRRADLRVPDGIGVVAAAKILYGIKLERVPGVELMEAICRESGRRGVKIFLYGAREEVNAEAVEKLKERYPDIVIAGRQNGYLPEDQFDELVERINASGADALFLALGSPRQEKWMNDYGDALNVGLCMGVGGSLDALTGKVKRAPLRWRRLNLEWLYRLLQQPSRIKRQRKIFVFGFKVVLLKLVDVLFIRRARKRSA